MSRSDDRAVLANGKPFIRSVLAFLSYLRFGLSPFNAEPVQYHYEIADQFIDQLDTDLK